MRKPQKPKTPTVTFSTKLVGTILLGKVAEDLLVDGTNTTVIAYLSKDKTKFYLEPIRLPSGAVVRKIANINNNLNGVARLHALNAFEGVVIEGRKPARWDDTAHRLEIDLAAKSE